MRLGFSHAAPRHRRHAPFLLLAVAVIGVTTAYGLMINAGWMT